ncbi:hypothetical protein FBZ85_106164 [Azospirillum brasilense]|uniref:Uncharacterized protein n=1 Tax=Azospirillum baldaniorum TaxID=1064539 RepID=A0A9P1JZU9_9PROT|nr:hypothetical protein [Azospirillum baldaniorum]TWA71900.1 hypothetical protein FBZ84_101166 [Azospirillum baldaniorum]TWA78004.1 hypothetical protein FBZ85_106164 [Azospirillum brasilense]CCD02894.1 protein of unknown function [Azospirillum baldaniorum]
MKPLSQSLADAVRIIEALIERQEDGRHGTGDRADAAQRGRG